MYQCQFIALVSFSAFLQCSKACCCAFPGVKLQYCWLKVYQCQLIALVSFSAFLQCAEACCCALSTNSVMMPCVVALLVALGVSVSVDSAG